jgi:TPP-dependent trihydroxycyclohexane-1,2-dione (THcHDO) dehydratase
MTTHKMTPSEALVETLAAEGVETVFGIVGSAYMDALDLFPAAGIRFVSVAHEQAAAHAADGLARVTGLPQACIAQNGPGAANFVSAITAAYWAHSPVVAITPETGSMGIGTGGFQELDQMAWFSEQTVWQVRVNRPGRMAELARRAFYMAKLENGPTQLNIPRDYFYGELEDEVYPSLEISRGPGSRAALAEASKLLAAAKYPVIIAGGGVSQETPWPKPKPWPNTCRPLWSIPICTMIPFHQTTPWQPVQSDTAAPRRPCGFFPEPTWSWRWAAVWGPLAPFPSTTWITGPKTPGSSRWMPMHRFWV